MSNIITVRVERVINENSETCSMTPWEATLVYEIDMAKARSYPNGQGWHLSDNGGWLYEIKVISKRPHAHVPRAPRIDAAVFTKGGKNMDRRQLRTAAIAAVRKALEEVQLSDWNGAGCWGGSNGLEHWV